MNRITKINFAGFAVSAAILSASAFLTASCGPPEPLRPLNPTTQPGYQPLPFTPQQVSQNPQYLSDISQFNQAQITGLLGTYDGNIEVENEDGERLMQPYTIQLGTAQSSLAPGKTFIQATFNSGNLSMQSLMQVNMTATNWGATGPTYTLTSPPISAPSIYQHGSVILLMQLTLNSANQFDPAQSPIIYIVDSVFFNGVVGFYDDIQKH